MTKSDVKLRECPFCGSSDIDPEGVSSFKPDKRHNEDGTLRNWNEHATPENIECSPACSNCGASTDEDWNTRHTDHLIEMAVGALSRGIDMFDDGVPEHEWGDVKSKMRKTLLTLQHHLGKE